MLFARQYPSQMTKKCDVILLNLSTAPLTQQYLVQMVLAVWSGRCQGNRIVTFSSNVHSSYLLVSMMPPTLSILQCSLPVAMNCESSLGVCTCVRERGVTLYTIPLTIPLPSPLYTPPSPVHKLHPHTKALGHVHKGHRAV